MCRNCETVYLVLAYTDVFALVWAGWHFQNGKKAHRHWLKLRIRAELLRQYAFLNMLFPLQAGAITQSYDQQVEQIEKNVLRPDKVASLATFRRKISTTNGAA